MSTGVESKVAPPISKPASTFYVRSWDKRISHDQQNNSKNHRPQAGSLHA